MIGPIDVKQKVNASVGYWVNYVTLTFDLTHDLDHIYTVYVAFSFVNIGSGKGLLPIGRQAIT